jgi:hypothetical protein
MSFSTILHKRSLTPGAIPTPASLSAGEIAINVASGKLFIKTADNAIRTFLNADQLPFVFNETLSSYNFQYGNNSITGILAGVLNGIDNDVSGAGSTVVNGSDNDIEADYAFIGNGSENKILSSGDFGAILGGQNNILNHPESFILGSNITSHLSGVTYVNNLSATGKIYGDGSELTGIVAGDTEATTLVRSNSGYWQETYTTVISNSANWDNPQIDVVLTSDPLKFVFIGDGSTTSYTVSGAANSTNASLIEVFVDNVRQEPTFSYTLSSEIVEFTEAPELSSRIVIITPNTIAGQLSVAKRHEFIDEDTYSISYAAIAPYGTPDIATLWRITKIIYTDTGTISATQYADNVAWSDRLTITYN